MAYERLLLSSATITNQSIRRFGLLLTVYILPLIWLTALPAQAQDEPADTTVQAQVEPEWPADSLGRRTPRGTMSGFIKAVANQNYRRASLYLNLDSTLQQPPVDPEQLARSLQRLMDQRAEMMPFSWLSDKPSGIEDDNLGPDLDRVGTAKVDGEEFDLTVEKTKDLQGAPVWLFSTQTVQRIPLIPSVEEEEAEVPDIDRYMPGFLKDNTWGGVPIGHWLAILVLAVLAYMLARGITALVQFFIPWVWAKAREEATEGVIRAFALPIRLYLAVWIFVAATQQVGVSIIVRLRLSEITVIVGLVAVLLLFWRLLDFITRLVERRLMRHNNQAGVSALLFLRRSAKIALLAFGIIIALDTFGFDVTTGLAALGIGGIALALGAQKTVENFVGSVTLIADQPVRVGDFCKVGGVTGTVEQIGMRSTRLRTGERTVVTIPNGEFSSLHIENYAHRDRYLFNPVLGLRYETTPDQIRYLLVELRSILYAHPKVSPDPARIRFAELGKDSLNLEIYSYIAALNFDEFLEVKEDLLLRMMDVVEASGTGFAFSSQTLYLAPDQGISEEKAKKAGEKVKEWREAGQMQIPKFDSERIQQLRNSISYPPEGSAQ